MKKFIITIILGTYLPWLHANGQINSTAIKTNQVFKPHSLLTQVSKQPSGTVITVGGDLIGCHYNNIQDAIDNVQLSGDSEIHIATNKTYFENLLIDDFSVTLIGGYQDCVAAGSPFINRGNELSIVDGFNTASPVLRINGDSQRNNVILKNLAFKNGTSDDLLSGGGIVTTEANVRVFLEKTTVDNNTATIGGGLSILGGNTDFIISDTYIMNNTAEIGGGGIYCAGNEASVLIGKNSGIIANQATSAFGQGGGAYVASGCHLSLYSSAVNLNQAKADGGGIYAADGATVLMIGYQVCADISCYGDQQNSVRFNHNTADSDNSGQGEGGAIYATGEETFISMSEVWLDFNTAFNGGAISVREGADFLLLGPSKNCIKRFGPFSKRCNIFDSNVAHNSGGAIYNNGGLIDAFQFTFEKNRADFGTAIYAINSNSYVGLTGSMLIRNGNSGEKNDLGEFLDFYVIRSANAFVEIEHNTITANKAVDAVFGVANTSGSHLNVVNSIVYDSGSGQVLNTAPGSTFFSCVLAHEANSFSGNQIVVDNPEFRNLEISDYHLNAQTSPAVDFCTDPSGSGFIDIDGEVGGWDDPNRPNLGGNPAAVFDAGADETYENDLIFIHGFEAIIDL